MPTSPPSVTIRPHDSPKPIWFTAWTFVPGRTVHISVSTTFFGTPPVSLDHWPVWKFTAVIRHDSGTGVVASLYFDHVEAARHPECEQVYKLLWDNKATLNAVCTYADHPNAEPLTIQLET